MPSVKQAVKNPTRGTNILDLIFTNCGDFFKPPEILAPIASSDHATIVWKSTLQEQKKNATKKMRVRPLRPAAVRAFREFVTNCDWSFILSTNDINDKVNAFLEFTQVSIDFFFPIKTFKLHEDDKPFITGRLKKLMAKRNKAHKSVTLSSLNVLEIKLLRRFDLQKRTFTTIMFVPPFVKILIFGGRM